MLERSLNRTRGSVWLAISLKEKGKEKKLQQYYQC